MTWKALAKLPQADSFYLSLDNNDIAVSLHHLDVLMLVRGDFVRYNYKEPLVHKFTALATKHVSQLSTYMFENVRLCTMSVQTQQGIDQVASAAYQFGYGQIR